MSKQLNTISENCHKSEKILCHVAATQEIVSLLKLWIFEEVSRVLYKDNSLPGRKIFRFLFKQFNIKTVLISVFWKVWKWRKFPKNAQKNVRRTHFFEITRFQLTILQKKPHISGYITRTFKTVFAECLLLIFTLAILLTKTFLLFVYSITTLVCSNEVSFCLKKPLSKISHHLKTRSLIYSPK